MMFEVRPAIVLLHGFSATGASWDGVVDALGERYRALTPDLPGHGDARDARPISFAACVADTAALLPGPSTLVGYSMGARLALCTALAQPGQIERLVLISGTAGIADAAEREARRADDEALAATIETQTIEVFARRWGAQPLFKGQPPAVAEAAHEDRLRNDPEGLAAALRGIGTGVMEPLWSRLGELRMPLTVIAGERDGRFAKLGERLVAGAPDARLLVVPGAGHAVHLEAPALVSTCIGETTATPAP